MKQTLYQILGVEPNASFEDIAIAFGVRQQELSRAGDHNALVVLNQANEILSDAIRRSAYDASLAAPVARAPDTDEPESETAPRSRGKWLVAAAVLIGIVIWWSNRESPPPAQIESVPQLASEAVEPESDSEQLLTAPPEPGAAEEPSAPAAAAPATEQTTAKPIVGAWSCFDPVSGNTHRYHFSADGRLDIEAADTPTASHKYAVSGNELTFTGSDAPGSMTIEQMSVGKMVLNTGAEGRRLACTR